MMMREYEAREKRAGYPEPAATLLPPEALATTVETAVLAPRTGPQVSLTGRNGHFVSGPPVEPGAGMELAGHQGLRFSPGAGRRHG
jgi:hypothetical protein